MIWDYIIRHGQTTLMFFHILDKWLEYTIDRTLIALGLRLSEAGRMKYDGHLLHLDNPKARTFICPVCIPQ